MSLQTEWACWLPSAVNETHLGHIFKKFQNTKENKKKFLEIPREKNNKKILFKGLEFKLATDDLKWSNNLMFKDKTTFNLEFYFQ